MGETKGLIRESKFTSTARQAGAGWDWVHISFVFFPVKGGGCNKKASPMYDVLQNLASLQLTDTSSPSTVDPAVNLGRVRQLDLT